MKFLEALDKQLLFFDGAMGTQLQARGLQAGERPEIWNLLHPEVVQEVQEKYLEAGVHILKANTFGVNPYKTAGTEYTVEQLVQGGMQVARNAVAAFEAQHPDCAEPHFVALDMGSLGKLMPPMGMFSFDEAYEAFAQVVRAGRDMADLVLIETMNDAYEMKAAVLAVKENSDLPVVVTMVLDENGRLLTGGDIPAAVTTLEGLGADCIGMNCALGPKQMLGLLPVLKNCCSKPLVINPNAGMPELVDGQTVFKIGSEEFAADQLQMLQAGAQALGGCCGTSPDHIAHMIRLVKGAERQTVCAKALTMVSTYGQHLVLGEDVIVGGRIDPDANEELVEALLEDDLEFLVDEAFDQQEEGAQVISVNVAADGVDETDVLVRGVQVLQGMIKLPLMLCTSNAAALEKALRQYNGKALVRVEENAQELLPIVKKYGGVVVCEDTEAALAAGILVKDCLAVDKLSMLE